MQQLIWNEGLSVGIERIDDDHKKIINVLEQVINAIENDCSIEQIENTFSDLENYVVQHFSYEESFMAQIGYEHLEEHKKSHQKFIRKIASLKEQLLTQDIREIAESISFYLRHWIVNHIIDEDMSYVTKNNDYQLNNKQKKTLFQTASAWLSQNYKLTSRIFIITIFPIMTMAMLSYMILNKNYISYNNAASLTGVNEIISKINTLSHQLQFERGLANGYIGSHFQSFKDEYIQQQILSNKALASLQQTLTEQNQLVSHTNITPYLDSFNKSQKQLLALRNKMNKGQGELSLANTIYNRAIEQLLFKVSSLTHLEIESYFTNDILAISTILRLKEVTGQLRGIGTSLIELSEPNIMQHITINYLFGKQLELLRLFKLSASNEQNKLCIRLCDKLFTKTISDEEFVRNFHLELKSKNSKIWFTMMSSKIDSLKVLTDEMINQLDLKTKQKVADLYQYNITIVFILGLTLLLTLFISIIVYHSIMSPIRIVTQALNRITLGHKDRRISTPLAKDEINELFESYEKLRRKQLQADIIQGENTYQKSLLNYRKKQKEHFQQLATLDPLTGAFNRRSLTNILNQEVVEANKNSSALSLMALDIDFFKAINDNYGHGAGDEVLKSFYQACLQNVRSSDYIIRSGGEEFIIILPSTSLEKATDFAQRLRKTIESLTIEVEENIITLTVSIGVSQWDKKLFSSGDELINRADQRLYKAKNSGRNCVVSIEK